MLKSTYFLISLLFFIWAITFIYQTSFLIGNERYFCLCDDAMISLRYGWNLAHGKGLVWNEGERVEGYTNFLQVLVMALVSNFFSLRNSVLAIQILGLLEILCAGWIFLQILKERLNLTYSFPAVLLLLAIYFYYPLPFWTLYGMETGLLLLELALVLLFLQKYLSKKKTSLLHVMGAIAAISFLTRNDSLLLYFFVGVFLSLKEKSFSKTFPYWFWLILALIFQELFRFLYYGDLLPNTYYLKLYGKSLSIRLYNGILYQYYFFKQTFLWWGVLLFLAFWNKIKNKLDDWHILLFLLVIINIVYVIYIGGDSWFFWRFFAPINPILWLLLVELTYLVFFEKKVYLGKKGLLIMFFLLIFLLGQRRFLAKLFFWEKPFFADSNKKNVKVAVLLKKYLQSKASVGVFWAGAIPYYTQLKGVDFLGKCDTYISHLTFDPEIKLAKGFIGRPGHDKYDLNYSIKKLQPTYIQEYRWGKDDLSNFVKKSYREKVLKIKDVEVKIWLKKGTILRK